MQIARAIEVERRNAEHAKILAETLTGRAIAKPTNRWDTVTEKADRSPRSTRHLAVALLLERDGNRCYLCRQEFVEGVRRPCIDHIIPIARGGTNEPSNVALACGACNSEKLDYYVSLMPSGRPVYHQP